MLDSVLFLGWWYAVIKGSFITWHKVPRIWVQRPPGNPGCFYSTQIPCTKVTREIRPLLHKAPFPKWYHLNLVHTHTYLRTGFVKMAEPGNVHKLKLLPVRGHLFLTTYPWPTSYPHIVPILIAMAFLMLTLEMKILGLVYNYVKVPML